MEEHYTKWLDIKAAPKDGRPILGYAQGDMATVYWFQWKVGDRYDGYWNLCVSGTFTEDDEWNPEFWMPLPDPPNQQG